MVKRSKKYIIYSIVLLLVVGLSVGFSAFQKQLLIDDSIFDVRIHEDVRLSNMVVSHASNAVSNTEDFNVKKLYGNITFDSASSYVLYKIDLTNYGNVKSGLLKIDNNTSGVNYSICDSAGSNCTTDVQTPVCSGSNCTLGTTKEIYLKVGTTSAGTKSIDLDFDFEPYNTITYTNFSENINSFKTEILSHDTYQVTFTSKPEQVDVSGTVTYTYNKNTGVLDITDVESNINIQAKYLATDVVETTYTGNDPDNYVLLGDELFRIITKGSVADGYGNTENRVKIIKDSSIGQYAYNSNGDSYTFSDSTIKDILNITYYNSLSQTEQELIDTAKHTYSIFSRDPVAIRNFTSYFALINKSDYTSNSSWLNNDQFTIDVFDEYYYFMEAIVNGGDSYKKVSTLMDTYPVTYLRSDVLIVGGSGTRTNPYQLELKGDGLMPNPTKIVGKTLTFNNTNQEIIEVTNKVGTPYYSTSQLNSSNYTSGTTTIPRRTAAGSYTYYYYIPAGSGYKAKSGSVTARINGLTFAINYQKGENISSIGKESDTCTTTGTNTSCNVTLPTITPSAGWENGMWYNGSNSYNPNASFTLNSSNSGVTLTAQVTGKTFVATIKYYDGTGVGSKTESCTVSSGNDCSVIIPSAVSSSRGVYNSTYKGLASAINTMTSSSTLRLTDSGTFYAVYSSPVTNYYYNSSYTSRTLYRNEYFNSENTLAVKLATENDSTQNSGTSNGPGNSAWTGFSTSQDTTMEYNSIETAASSTAATLYSVYTFSINYQKGLNVAEIGSVGDVCRVTTSDTECNVTLPTISPTAGHTSLGWNTTGVVEPGMPEGSTYPIDTNGTTLYANAQGSTYTATFYYYNGTGITTTTKTCTVVTGSTCNVSIPNVVSNSTGKYGSTYKGVATTTSSMDTGTLTLNSNTSKFYAIYSEEVTRYYYSSGYKTNTIYRNEYFLSDTQMVSVLSTVDNGTTNYTSSRGPGSSNFVGLSTAQDTAPEYTTVQDAANSTSKTLYTVYEFVLNYEKSVNVSEIGATSATCRVTTSDTTCNVILPTITPNTGYVSVGWSETNGATTGSAPLTMYTINTNNRTLYANATAGNYINTTTNESYSTLNEAFSDVANNQTIKVLQNVTETTTATLGSGKTGIKLDLNGKTVTMSNTYIDNIGALDIYNTSNTTGTINGGVSQVIYNQGTLTLNGTSSTNKIIIDKTSNNDDNPCGAIRNNSSSLTINTNAEVKVSAGSSPGIKNTGGVYHSGATVTINGGTISGTTLGIDSGTIIINSGTISGSTYGIYNVGIATINGGTISGSTYGIWNEEVAELRISGNSTQITGTTTGGILNYGNVILNSGTITGPTYGLFNTGEATILGGTISSNRRTIYLSSGTLTLGTNDSTVSTSSPLIQTTGTNSNYAIDITSGGTFNFYDGTISSASGTGYSINGTIADIPDGYQVYKETVSGVESAYLVDTVPVFGGYLMEVYGNGLPTQNYLRTNISRNNIESLTFVDSLGNHTANGTNCWDASRDSNGSVLSWVEDSDSDGIYEMTIGANGIIHATSGYDLFSQLTKLDSLNGMDNFSTEGVTNMRTMFYQTGSESTVFTLDLGNNFDTSHVTDMGSMFRFAGNNSPVFTLNLGNKFDTSRVINMNGMFAAAGYKNPNFTLDLGNKFDTSSVTDMGSMFNWVGYSSSNFTLDLGDKFDTSNVTDMSSMFNQVGYNATTLTIILGDYFNTSNVTTMNGMFQQIGYKATNFTLDLGDSFNTSKVTNMYQMFYNTGYTAPNFTLDLGSNFDTSKVENFSNMFYNTGYNSTVFTLDLGNKFDTSSAINMGSMFGYTGYKSTVLTLDLGDKFDTSHVTNMSNMFNYTGFYSKVFTLDLGNKFDTSSVTSMYHMFYRTGYSSTVFTLDLGDKFDTTNVTNMAGLFYQVGYNNTSFTFDLGDKFDTSKVTNMSEMFGGIGNKSLNFTLDLGDKFDTSLVTNMSKMFYYSAKLKTIYAPASFVNDSVTSSGQMFSGCTLLVGGQGTVYDANHVDAAYAHIDGGTANPGYFTASGGTLAGHDNDYEHFFNISPINSSSVKSLTFQPYMTAPAGSLGSWDASQDFDGSVIAYYTDNNNDGYYEVTVASNGKIYAPQNSSYLFTELILISTINGLEYLDTSNVTDMSYMFNYTNFTSLDVSHFDTSNVTNMSFMFSDCRELIQLDVSHFDTSNVTNMSYMFQGCWQLLSLDLSHFNTANVTDMSGMFSSCLSLSSLDLNYSNFDTSNVTNMSFMFYSLSALPSLDLNISNFNTSKVTDMNHMFDLCESLTSLDLSGSNFDTSRVTDMNAMFARCDNLITINLDGENFGTSSVTDMNRMFSGDIKLKNIYFNKSIFTTLYVTNMNSMFSGCSSLTYLDLSLFKTSRVTNMGGMFADCTNLVTIRVDADFSTSAVTNSSSMFKNCTSLIGGNGTVFNSNYTDKTYARIDGGTVYPGYFTGSGGVLGRYKTDFANYSSIETITLQPYLKAPNNYTESLDVSLDNDNSVICYYSDYDNDGYYELNIQSAGYIFAPQDSSGLFWDLPSLTAINGLEYLDTSNVTTMAGMFGGTYSLHSLDVSHFNTSNVENMSSMFWNTDLDNLDVSHFDTSRVVYFNGMFQGLHNVPSLDVRNFDTSRANAMNNMFSGCSGLTELDLSNFDTSGVNNMDYMFDGLENVITIYVGNNFVTGNVTSSNYMFAGCTSLVGGAGTAFNTSNPTDKTYAHVDGGTSNPGYFTYKNSTASSGVLSIGDVGSQVLNSGHLINNLVNKAISN